MRSEPIFFADFWKEKGLTLSLYSSARTPFFDTPSLVFGSRT